MIKRSLSNLELTYSCETDFDEPDRYRDLFSVDYNRRMIAQGAGLSYAAASFYKQSLTLSMRKFNRILDFSPENETISIETGTTLIQLYNFLYPRGFYISIQPGWPDLCIGSLIATNAHGKNPYCDGVFADITNRLVLFHPVKGIIQCSKDENRNIFNLTCGGLGLTGIILSAEIKIKKLHGNWVKRKLIQVKNLNETISIMSENKDRHDIMMSWTNLAKPSGRFGRGFIITGDFYFKDRPLQTPNYRTLDPNDKYRLRGKIFNRFSIPFLNEIYYRVETRKKTHDVPLFNALFPFHNKWFYFDFYGRKGFIANQLLIPETNIKEFIRDLKKIIRDSNVPIVLSAFKAFKGEKKYINFNGDGWSFYTDLLNNNSSLKFFKKLNRIAVDHGCISNVLRNSFLSKDVVKKQYGEEYDKFRHDLKSYDPKRIFVSEVSIRLGL